MIKPGSRKKGLVKVEKRLCKGCNVCVEFCPLSALKLDENGKAFQASDACNACGLCELYCPDFAIEVEQENSNEP